MIFIFICLFWDSIVTTNVGMLPTNQWGIVHSVVPMETFWSFLKTEVSDASVQNFAVFVSAIFTRQGILYLQPQDPYILVQFVEMVPYIFLKRNLFHQKELSALIGKQ